MKNTISQDKLFKVFEWVLFIGFSIQAFWFASGVLEQFFSQKTSYSLSAEMITDYPVITIVPLLRPPSEINLTNIVITYHAEGMKLIQEGDDFSSSVQKLEFGENHFHNVKYNITEKVILKNLDDMHGGKAFQIIHATPVLTKEMTQATIEMYTKLENNSHVFSDIWMFYLTSQKNSPGPKAFLFQQQYHPNNYHNFQGQPSLLLLRA